MQSPLSIIHLPLFNLSLYNYRFQTRAAQLHEEAGHHHAKSCCKGCPRKTQPKILKWILGVYNTTIEL